jgi:hypothetical protein
LPAEQGPRDPEPTWHQLVELPRTAAVVTEFQGHARTCPRCHRLNHDAVPAEIKAVTFGPRLAAALSYLSGCQHVSQRGLEEAHDEVRPAPGGGAGVEHAGDVGVVHQGQRLPLYLEAGNDLPGVHPGLDDLERHQAFDRLGLPGHPHRAHAALADRF